VAGKHVPSAAAPGATRDATAQVRGHIHQPHPVAGDTSGMRDGDEDRGGTTPQEPQTTVPGGAASEAWRGGGTP
jgi:hypothetical protein